MSRRAVFTGVCSLISATALFASLAAAETLPTAGPNRPANVPEDYIITPAGYFHTSCIVHLAEGDILHRSEKAIEHANGSFDSAPVCAYAHFSPKGERIEADAQNPVTGDEPPEAGARGAHQPTIGHAWIESVYAATSSSYGELGADWNVPAAPTTNSGQTIFFFPGMEDYADVVTIIQPVLGWNSDFASAWGIASWNCCVSGTEYEAPPQRVNVGDKIAGYMWDNCARGTLTCPSWDVLTYDLTKGVYSELMSTSNFGQTFNWAFAGALEVYNVSQCSNYPAGGSLQFYDLELYNDSFVEYSNPGWVFWNTSGGLTPQCGYGASISPTAVTLYY
jgi:hypothetical protein